MLCVRKKGFRDLEGIWTALVNVRVVKKRETDKSLIDRNFSPSSLWPNGIFFHRNILSFQATSDLIRLTLAKNSITA